MPETSSANSAAAFSASQVLTFQLGNEYYGINILQVQEIRGWSAVTRIVQSPPHVLGVLNLRGSIVPVIDMRRRFGLSEAGFTPKTVIIVISVVTTQGRRECGVVVDSVSDVVDIQPDSIKPAPETVNGANSRCIAGLLTVDERMFILLNVDELIATDLRDPALAVAA
jgi:purine-binding chemotaxis protein CheW